MGEYKDPEVQHGRQPAGKDPEVQHGRQPAPPGGSDQNAGVVPDHAGGGSAPENPDDTGDRA